MAEFFLGKAQIRLRDLDVDACREPNERAVKKLLPVFQHNCKPMEDANHIVVNIYTNHLPEILSQSGVSLESLVNSQEPYVQLHPSQKVQCIHGRQRYETAKRLGRLEMWWTVKIFCTPEGSDPLVLLREPAEKYHYETEYSDGHIFLKVRKYRRERQPELEEIWRKRLSECKQTALRRLENTIIVEKLDKLAKFSGLWNTLQLGNIEKYLAMQAIDLIVHCLDRIHDWWVDNTLHDPIIQKATDSGTVRDLELRIPSASREDREMIKRKMLSGELFPRVTDPDMRRTIQAKLLQTTVLIPSFRVFQENMKYLNIGTRILKSNFIDRLDAGQTLYGAMTSIWRPPERCLVECQEGEFREVPLQPDVGLAYQQVVISVFRDFPHLSEFSPRCERGKKPERGEVQNHCRLRLLKRAQILGFNSEKIETEIHRLEQGSLVDLHKDLPRTDTIWEPVVDRRCNRPFQWSFQYFNTHMFIPQLIEDHGITNVPSTLTIQRDFIRSFFGELPPRCDFIGTSLFRIQIPERHLERPLEHPETYTPSPLSTNTAMRSYDTVSPLPVEAANTDHDRISSISSPDQNLRPSSPVAITPAIASDHGSSVTRSLLSPEVCSLETLQRQAQALLSGSFLDENPQILTAAAWALGHRNRHLPRNDYAEVEHASLSTRSVLAPEFVESASVDGSVYSTRVPSLTFSSNSSARFPSSELSPSFHTEPQYITEPDSSRNRARNASQYTSRTIISPDNL